MLVVVIGGNGEDDGDDGNDNGGLEVQTMGMIMWYGLTVLLDKALPSR